MTKRKELLWLWLLLVAAGLNAQNTPQHYFHTPANAGVNNSFFLDGFCNKFVFIYTQPEIAGMVNPVTGSLTIDTIWFRHGGSSSNPSTTFTSLVVTLGHSSLAAPVANFAANFNAGPAQVVLSAASYTYTPNIGAFNVPADNWTPIVLQTPFTYNFTDNLAVQFEFAISSSAIVGHYADNGGPAITQYASPSTATTASSTTSRPMFGLSAGCGAAVQLGPDTTLCSGQQLTLNAGSPSATHTWSTGATGSTLTVSTAGTYWVTVSDSCGVRSDTLVVAVNAQPVATAGADQFICAGDVTQLTASGGTTYSWLPVSGLSTPSSASTTANPVATTSYTVTVSNGTCIASDTVLVTVLPLPGASAGSDITINIGGSATLVASGNGSYIWAPGTGLSCTTCASPTATPTVTTTYVLTVTSADGCVQFDTLTVFVDYNCGDVFVPNVFSPNGDGTNDTLRVYNNCIVEQIFEVYDRWGNRVYYGTTIGDGWDGTYKGASVDNGIFAWQLRATLVNGQTVSLSGEAQVLK